MFRPADHHISDPLVNGDQNDSHECGDCSGQDGPPRTSTQWIDGPTRARQCRLQCKGRLQPQHLQLMMRSTQAMTRMARMTTKPAVTGQKKAGKYPDVFHVKLMYATPYRK